MILGEVKPSREAVIRVRIQGPDRVPTSIDAVVDTGFTDALAVPPELVRRLRLPFRGTMDYGLADGSHAEFDLFVAQVEWNGRWRDSIVAAGEGGALVGMELLLGCNLNIDVIDGGRVAIHPLGERGR